MEKFKKKRKKRHKRKLKYAPITNKTLVPEETREQMRAKFPADLVNAYIKVKETEFEDKKVYKKFDKLRNKYLGDKADDVIESGRLIVMLTRATMDLFSEKKKKQKKVLLCKDHPKYGAIRKPRKDCKACWDMYNNRKTK